MDKHFFNRPALEAIQKECLDLGERKSHDYSSVADAIGIGGVFGICVRLLDKVLRLMSLCIPGFASQVKEESIRDTFKDIINYATYAISLLDGTWGKEPSKIPLLPLSIFQDFKKFEPKDGSHVIFIYVRTGNIVGFVIGRNYTHAERTNFIACYPNDKILFTYDEDFIQSLGVER